jgi:membrane-associated phospholipid phosphatase
MKRQISGKLRKFKETVRSHFLWTLVPALLWLAATYARPVVISPRCSIHPELCTQESVLSIDRFSLGMENSLADEYSYNTQNFSGILALAVPATWTVFQWISGSMSPASAFMLLGTDLFTVLRVASWNGLGTELSHLLSQRPRPFVYSDPAFRGTDPAHYTAFYSGHTSFAAAMTLGTFFILLFRRAHWAMLLLSFSASEALILSTAYFRILAGRHFLTDVISGAIAGSLISYWVVSKTMNQASSQISSKTRT